MNALDLSAVRWRKSSHSGDTGGSCVEVADASWRKSIHSTGTGGDCVEVADASWRKSTHSGDTGGDCVEVTDVPHIVAVRDSKDPEGPVLGLTRAAFTAFVVTVRAGAHDL